MKARLYVAWRALTTFAVRLVALFPPSGIG